MLPTLRARIFLRRESRLEKTREKWGCDDIPMITPRTIERALECLTMGSGGAGVGGAIVGGEVGWIIQGQGEGYTTVLESLMNWPKPSLNWKVR